MSILVYHRELEAGKATMSGGNLVMWKTGVRCFLREGDMANQEGDLP